MNFNGSLRVILEVLGDTAGNGAYQEIKLIAGASSECQDELAQIELFSFRWFKLFQDLGLVAAEEVNDEQEQRLESISSIGSVSEKIRKLALKS